MQISQKSAGCKHPSKRAAHYRHTWWHNDHLETNKQLHSTKAIAPFHKRYCPPSLSLSLFPLSPICHKFILLHLTSLLLPELPINHCCCLTLSIFPETQGGCCRNWVRHNLQGSRAWLVMILLGNVAISTQWEIGGMGRGGWLGGRGGVVHDVTPKKSWQMAQFYRSPSTAGHVQVYVLGSECLCVIMLRFMFSVCMYGYKWIVIK